MGRTRKKPKKKPQTIANICGACGAKLKWRFDELDEPFYAIDEDGNNHFPDVCWDKKMRRQARVLEKWKIRDSRPF